MRTACPGFLSVQRYRAREADGYLPVHEMADSSALSAEPYGRVKGNPSDGTRWMLDNITGFTRYIAGEMNVRLKPGTGADDALDAPVIHAVWFPVPERERAEFDAWYESEHIPLLMNSPDWLMVRRFQVLDGEPEDFTRLSIHYLAREEALEPPERQAARETPWRARLAERDWFRGQYAVFRRHGARQAGR